MTGPVLKLKLKKIEHEVCGETLPGYHLLHSGAIGVFYTCKCSRASWTNKNQQKKKVFSKAVCLFISINYAWSPQTAIIVNVAFEDKQRLIICWIRILLSIVAGLKSKHVKITLKLSCLLIQYICLQDFAGARPLSSKSGIKVVH